MSVATTPRPKRLVPYFLTFDGKDYVIEANSRANAVAHLANPRVAVLRPAKPRDIADFVKAGGVIATAGEYPEKDEQPLLLKGDGSGTALPEVNEHNPGDMRTHGDESAVDD